MAFSDYLFESIGVACFAMSKRPERERLISDAARVIDSEIHEKEQQIRSLVLMRNHLSEIIGEDLLPRLEYVPFSIKS